MTDDEYASLIREKLKGPLSMICQILTEARKDRIEVNFAIGTDQVGQSVVQMINVGKVL